MTRILLAGGGTLGSVSPLLAVKESLPSADYLFIGTRKGPERYICHKFGLRYEYIFEAKLRRYFSLWTLFDIVKFPIAILQAFRIVRAYKPDIVLTSGGFVGVPTAIASRILGIAVIIHQQDLSIGLANKILKHLATAISVTFPQQKKLFPDYKTTITGNPLRTFLHKKYSEEKLIFIIGGSLGARSMNALVNTVIPELSKTHQVVHMLGATNFDQRLSLKTNYLPVKFLSQDFGKYLQKAQVVITRAGMATLSELAKVGKSTIIIPIPNTNQNTNAAFFEQAHAAIVVDQSQPDKLHEAINRLISSTSLRKDLGKNLHNLFPENANQNYLAFLAQYIEIKSEAKSIVFLIGIGGIGVSALARHFNAHNYDVYGSDILPNNNTAKLEDEGIHITYGHKRKNIPEGTRLVIYSADIPRNNIEILESKKRKIENYSYHEYLAVLSSQYRTIAVAGAHGKTTTTSLIGLALKDTHYDPTIIVGGLIPQLNYSNYRKGSSDMLILETCEYKGVITTIKPQTIVLTNIDAEHLDYFQDIEDIKRHFSTFVGNLSKNGLLIKNADDVHSEHITASNIVTYGLHHTADFQAKEIVVRHHKQVFVVYNQETKLGTFTLTIPGSFNIQNALATIALCSKLGVNLKDVAKSLENYTGSWRRFEKVGYFQKNIVYSDYAHHPTEIAATLQAYRSFYPDKNILLVFQPHSHSRTLKLLNEFSKCFTHADKLILAEIYEVSGRDSDTSISSAILRKRLPKNLACYSAEDNDQVVEILKKITTPDDLIIIMGAGNIDAVARAITR